MNNNRNINCPDCSGQLIGILENLNCINCNASFFICSECNELCSVQDMVIVTINGQIKYVCPDCYNKIGMCDICSTYHYRDNLQALYVQELGDILVCDTCWYHELVECCCCEDTLLIPNSYNYDGEHYCPDCFWEHFTSCTECDSIIPLESGNYHVVDGEIYCEDCARLQYIHDYYYKPDPIFHGSGSKYLGIELEIDRGDRDIAAAELYEVSNFERLFYLKDDGSLSGDGIEIVSMPCSLGFHLEQFPWKEIMETAREHGYVSHDCLSCGLHVHVSREAFGETESEQDLNIMKLVFLFEKHFEFFKGFSRRTWTQVRNYCDKYGSIYDTKDLKETVKYHNKRKNGRYFAVNLENNCTVEIRLWRGTLKLNTFFATLQFTSLLCELVCELGISRTYKLTEQDIINYVFGKYPELDQYLKERGIK